MGKLSVWIDQEEEEALSRAAPCPMRPVDIFGAELLFELPLIAGPCDVVGGAGPGVNVFTLRWRKRGKVWKP